jgi:ATP-dependent protease HslVU (ClpYQ) peptidase subunit
VVGISEAGHVLVAADSCVQIQGAEETTTPDAKVLRVGDWIVGIAGDWSGVLAARSIAPESATDVGSLWSALREAMTEWRVANEDWEALVAKDGDLWALDGVSAPLRIDSRSVGSRRNRTTRSTWAIGSGAPYARGALLALDDAPLTRQQRAEEALRVASLCSCGVRPPWRHEER